MRLDETVVEDNVRCLQQGVILLQSVKDELYHHKPYAQIGGGIGPHIRHTLDHYFSFFNGYKDARIDYDARMRNSRIEIDRFYARQQFQRAVAAFNDLTADFDRQVLVKVDSGSHNGEASWSRSTLRRELQFLVSHTIHHYAIIAILLRAQGFEPGEEFGVAPSTIAFRRSQRACVQ